MESAADVCCRRIRLFGETDVSLDTRQRLQNSLVLVHGGMAQNVGPVLEMVTEKYLLRSPAEWKARQTAIGILDQIKLSLAQGDIQAVGSATNRNFQEPLQTIIPWCHNLYTQMLIDRCRQEFGNNFWGFWMLGGMAGGGMGFIFDPSRKTEAQEWLQQSMLDTKQLLQSSLPFAMDPVVYDFEINDQGTSSELLCNEQARLPDSYYSLMLPG